MKVRIVLCVSIKDALELGKLFENLKIEPQTMEFVKNGKVAAVKRAPIRRTRLNDTQIQDILNVVTSGKKYSMEKLAKQHHCSPETIRRIAKGEHPKLKKLVGKA
jgi:DNA-binding Xre family transcriptional regulator